MFLQDFPTAVGVEHLKSARRVVSQIAHLELISPRFVERSSIIGITESAF
jgi:hypothetical protein